MTRPLAIPDTRGEADAILRELVVADWQRQNTMPPTRKRPAAPEWNDAMRRMAIAWEKARAYSRKPLGAGSGGGGIVSANGTDDPIVLFWTPEPSPECESERAAQEEAATGAGMNKRGRWSARLGMAGHITEGLGDD